MGYHMPWDHYNFLAKHTTAAEKCEAIWAWRVKKAVVLGFLKDMGNTRGFSYITEVLLIIF